MTGGDNGFRVSTIPTNARKLIQNIKEIGSNHSEEEIYATLKDCGMDPNETAQKLLLQGTFHEVKRKRDKKKENLINRETKDSRWRSGPSGRFGRGGQGGILSRYPADAGGGKHFVQATENGMKGSAGSLLPAHVAKEAKVKEIASASSVTLSDNNLTLMPGEHTSHMSSITSAKHSEASTEEKTESSVMENVSVALGGGVTNDYGQPQPSSRKGSGPAAVISGGHPSASDTTLVWSNESRPPGAVGVITPESGSQQCHAEPILNASTGSKLNAAAHGVRSLTVHGRMGSKSRGTGKNQHTEFSRPSSSSGHAGPSSSRPSSNYGNRSQQAIGPPKGLNKEWKPKTTNPSNVLVSITSAPSQQSSSAEKTDEQEHAVHGSISGSEEAAPEVEKELEGLHIKETHHVIIPNHIHVPEAVRTGLSFGSFGAAIVINSSRVNDPTTEKLTEHTSVSYQAVEDSAVEQTVSNDNLVAPAEEVDLDDHPQLSIHVPESVSSSGFDVPSSSVLDFNDSPEASDAPQQSVVHASPTYSFAGVPTPVLGNIAPFDSSDSQAHDASRVTSFVVQQPIDPASASYYAQLYRSGEGDGHISSFPSSGASSMYNGNIVTLPAEMSETSQEGGNHMSLSTIGQAPLAIQAGVMANNIAANQQAVSMFRQPQGMPMPHYPPNFFPYGPYFPPFFVQPPTVPQYMSNNAFLQQGQTSSVYPGPPTGSTQVKYPLSQFKPGSNSGNPAHMGINANYGPYGTSPTGYNTGSAPTGNSTDNDDLVGSQYKENMIYTAGQQSEGSTVWITTNGRDISGLQPNSYYNLPPQGQHMTFTPSQGGHSPFPSVYHPAQAGNMHHLFQQSQGMPGAADMVGPPPAGVYQQPQQATQMNWQNNY